MDAINHSIDSSPFATIIIFTPIHVWQTEPFMPLLLKVYKMLTE